MAGVFVRAEWRSLLMVNFEVDPAVLQPLVPGGTELDFHEGVCYASMVGFHFLKTRVRGVCIPFHENFDEVNLRFYVRRQGPEGWRRGVVFVKEIVPRWAIAAVARLLYNEKYVACPMRSNVGAEQLTFSWKTDGRWNELRGSQLGRLESPADGSAEQFITEHYWGYSAQPNGSTVEYRVEHVPWRVQVAGSGQLDCDVERTYGKSFVPALSRRPLSAFVAEGSPVTVSDGMRMETKAQFQSQLSTR